MGSQHQTKILDLTSMDGKPTGKVVVRADAIQESTRTFKL
jgi:hypothetical protein